jgi:membrane protease YdiL (CAAX protease family)
MPLRMRPGGALFVAVAFGVSCVASYLAFQPARAGTLSFWLLAAGPSIVLGAFAAAWAQNDDLLYEWLAPRWGDFTRGLSGAVVLFVLAWLFVRVVAPIGSIREIWLVSLYGSVGDPRVLQTHAVEVAVCVVAAAAAEEILWRGLVTQLLAESFGSRRAWIWAAALYALSMTPSAFSLRAGAGPNPVLFLAALGGGLLWGGMARLFGRLAPGILAHALFDWATVMMFPLWAIVWRR